jgi:asparagine synthase (glutamine-hydrolysing)
MCGISGIMCLRGVNVQTLKLMNDLIVHRGPDDEGYVLVGKDWNMVTAGGVATDAAAWAAESHYAPSSHIDSVTGNFFIGLGHRRLSILDLSPLGHMPMCDSRGEVWLAYNGEIYNFKEIRHQLQALGYVFYTETDTEVLIAAYQSWGMECLQRFVGMFAFALVDLKRKLLYLVRDRFAIKPLYYWISPSGGLYFGSEIKQFSATPDWTAHLNRPRAFDYLYAGQTDHSEETMFQGVYHILGGHYACIDLKNIDLPEDGKLPVVKWYNPEIKPFSGGFEDAVSLFREKFRESVRLHLRADVRVGCTLSGGFDSSSITCTVNELLQQQGEVERHHTFSAIDGDSIYSEKKWIEEVVRQLRVTPHFLTPDPAEALDDLGALAWKMDEPTGSMSPYLGYLVDRMAKQNGVTVLLSGQGADEYLGGYGAFRQAARLKALNALDLVGIQREYGCSAPQALKMAGRAAARQVYAALFPRSYASRYRQPVSGKPWLKYINTDLLGIDVDTLLIPGNPKVSYYRDISVYQLHSSPLPMYLRWGDRNSMAHSVEARVPFLDHRLVEFCHSLPPHYVEDNQMSKRILLEAMKDILPPAIYHRKDKMGYVAPEERWVKSEHTSVFRDLIANSVQYAQGIIKDDARDYLEALVAGKEGFNFAYWRLIMFGFWMERFNVQHFI